jgi:hypothetical protein
LYGAFESLEEQVPENYWSSAPAEVEWRDGHAVALRRAFGDEGFESARDAGRRMEFDQVLDLALGRSKNMA